MPLNNAAGQAQASRPIRGSAVGVLTHDELLSRNWAFITPEAQRILDQQVIFAAGVGLSSMVATLACRTGFSRFILADGDNVDASNLNRQAFDTSHIGRNKAEATAELLCAIRPDVEIEVIPQFLSLSSYEAVLQRSTVVVNSIDFNNPALFALNQAAQTHGIPCVQPLNLGWGGAVLVFDSSSPSLAAFLELDDSVAISAPPPDVLQRLIRRIFASAPGGVPNYLAQLFVQLMDTESAESPTAAWPNQPQLGVATMLTSAMVVRAAVALVTGERVRTAPDVNYCDLRALLEGTS